jgi:hypothetical protein
MIVDYVYNNYKQIIKYYNVNYVIKLMAMNIV